MPDYQRTRREAAQKVFRAWKVEQGCRHCGYNAHHYALQIDHIVPIKSKYRWTVQSMLDVERLVNNTNIQILCARCHAVKTRKEKDYLPANPKPSKFDQLTPGQQTSYRTAQARQKKVRTYLDVIRLARGCCQCGWDEHYAGIDFDHIEPERRKRANSRIVNPPNPLKVYEFINDPNIQILCCNCHAIKTWENKDYLAIPKEEEPCGLLS